MKVEDYCREKAAPAGSALYYSILYHRQQQKRKLTALFALQQELVDTVTDCQDADVARTKLQWWHEEIHRLFDSQARHPVSRALQGLLPDLELEQAELFNLVDAIAGEINPVQADSMTQLINYFTRSRGRTWQLAALACNCQHVQTIEQVATIGGLSSCLDFFKISRRHLARGYCPYPRLEMERHGLQHQNLLQTDKLTALVNLQMDLFTTIQSDLEQSLKVLCEKNDPNLLFALTMANIEKANCSLIRKQTQDISIQPRSLTPLRKLWIAWRTKRQVAASSS